MTMVIVMRYWRVRTLLWVSRQLLRVATVLIGTSNGLGEWAGWLNDQAEAATRRMR